MGFYRGVGLGVRWKLVDGDGDGTNLSVRRGEEMVSDGTRKQTFGGFSRKHHEKEKNNHFTKTKLPPTANYYI